MATERSNFDDPGRPAADPPQDAIVTRGWFPAIEHVGSAGGGLVKVTVRGGEVTAVLIDQRLVGDGDAEELSELVLTALRLANEAQKMSGMMRETALSTESYPVPNARTS
ncbi:YbaB/EbfC family nucleoid-associated protein [Catenulispora sp. NF23]|uniref:YbaB/EbfC family nucleoid-associated protein n=1 Tax=Catenulispora pinistramenti TaxID=2705254 RepID=A0ABS5KQ42_9ACTN|nr:YbaB/EbfC family nucleoid-associated protein [Catenulispora pinistramenti]MBS2533138.1 YbaB/EbfC family nucleoid-associated protein [Catenulispora pinistramenti]MBS2548173.1 YbaB/EbfC family nucleoid-associated protein [Catenulispora pinistramenti]